MSRTYGARVLRTGMGVTTTDAAPPRSAPPKRTSLLARLFGKKERKPRPFTPIGESDALPTLKSEPLHDIDAARKRSLMYQKPTVCNGERDGFACKHFWDLTQIPSSANPDMLKDGERFRLCTFFKGWEPLMMENGKEGMALDCNRYEKDDSLVYISKKEEYDPLKPDEYAALVAGEIKNLDDLMKYRARRAEREAAVDAEKSNEAAQAGTDNVSIDDVMNDVGTTKQEQ